MFSVLLSITLQFFIDLRNFYETARAKLWPKIKKLLLLGLEPGFLEKRRAVDNTLNDYELPSSTNY